MPKLAVRLERMDRAKKDEKSPEQIRVTFKVGQMPFFNIPIWLPAGTDEGEVIKVARQKLHELSLDLASSTESWKAS